MKCGILEEGKLSELENSERKKSKTSLVTVIPDQ